jgi:hypothetical protein
MRSLKSLLAKLTQKLTGQVRVTHAPSSSTSEYIEIRIQPALKPSLANSEDSPMAEWMLTDMEHAFPSLGAGLDIDMAGWSMRCFPQAASRKAASLTLSWRLARG